MGRSMPPTIAHVLGFKRYMVDAVTARPIGNGAIMIDNSAIVQLSPMNSNATKNAWTFSRRRSRCYCGVIAAHHPSLPFSVISFDV